MSTKVNLSIVTIIVSFIACTTISKSHAIIDPCFRQNNAVLRADRNVVIAENMLDRTILNADNVQNSIAIQIANLQARVADAQAQVSAANALANGQNGGCVVTGLFFGFGRLGGCLGGSIANNAARRARAQANVNSSIARLNSYIIYAEGRTRREQQRIVNAQEQLARRRAELDVANNALNQCRIQSVTTTNPY
jgi:hypothetical protein